MGLETRGNCESILAALQPQAAVETLPVGQQVPKLSRSQIFRAAHILRRPQEAIRLDREKP